MLEHLENLSTWKFWVLIVAVFLPIWVLVTWVIYADKRISIKGSPPEVQILLDQMQVINQKQQMINSKLLAAKVELLTNSLSNKYVIFKKESPEKINIENEKQNEQYTQVFGIQLIPQGQFLQIQEELKQLKDISQNYK